MHLNRDIEKLVNDSKCHKQSDKFNEVALQLVRESDKHDVAQKIKKQWEIRRVLVRAGNTEELEKWRAEKFPLPAKLLQESSTSDVTDSGTGACASDDATPGRPTKRLSDNPGRKTENNILDRIIQDLEDSAQEQNIAPQVLLEKLVQRSQEKWNKKSPSKKKDVPVKDASAMMFNVNLSIQQYQKL